MDEKEIRVEIFYKEFGWTQIKYEELVKGDLFRMFDSNNNPVLYQGLDRWIYVDTKFVATTGKTVLNIKPYISLVKK